ncbi:unnamed protein product [Microthlaspi erraticum]|uniref:Arabidopsis retrotransposon Orf1 C-terminal domain-containing protein n=1 Tax=Microthlaspi erraticum TaxID=1685480 RepID=A0A6D2JXT0_9BRAS|nr:unnamed protein product [Microthlaspi erraticum]
MDLGEPECYYFEEYEAPRMNPSVVAAHKRIGLLQRFNKWQGKAMEKMQKSMDKMITPHHPRRLPAQEPHRASSFEPREGEDNTQRRRKSSKARRSNSIESEETQLDRAEGRVDLEEPLFENPDSSTIHAYQDFLRDWTPTTASSKHSSTKAKEPHHFEMKKRKKRRASSIECTTQ